MIVLLLIVGAGIALCLESSGGLHEYRTSTVIGGLALFSNVVTSLTVRAPLFLSNEPL
jgi:hypothetical protein